MFRVPHAMVAEGVCVISKNMYLDEAAYDASRSLYSSSATHHIAGSVSDGTINGSAVSNCAVSSLCLARLNRQSMCSQNWCGDAASADQNGGSNGDVASPIPTDHPLQSPQPQYCENMLAA